MDLVCHTCGGKRFFIRASGMSPKNNKDWEHYECRRCGEWITVTYTDKCLEYNHKKTKKNDVYMGMIISKSKKHKRKNV